VAVSFLGKAKWILLKTRYHLKARTSYATWTVVGEHLSGTVSEGVWEWLGYKYRYPDMTSGKAKYYACIKGIWSYKSDSLKDCLEATEKAISTHGQKQ